MLELAAETVSLVLIIRRRVHKNSWEQSEQTAPRTIEGDIGGTQKLPNFELLIKTLDRREIKTYSYAERDKNA